MFRPGQNCSSRVDQLRPVLYECEGLSRLGAQENVDEESRSVRGDIIRRAVTWAGRDLEERFRNACPYCQESTVILAKVGTSYAIGRCCYARILLIGSLLFLSIASPQSTRMEPS